MSLSHDEKMRDGFGIECGVRRMFWLIFAYNEFVLVLFCYCFIAFVSSSPSHSVALSHFCFYFVFLAYLSSFPLLGREK